MTNSYRVAEPAACDSCEDFGLTYDLVQSGRRQLSQTPRKGQPFVVLDGYRNDLDERLILSLSRLTRQQDTHHETNHQTTHADFPQLASRS